MPADWNKIKREYIRGGTSYRKLAEKYDVSLTAIKCRSKRDGWIEAKAQVKHKTDTKIIESESERAARMQARINENCERLMDKISASIEMMEPELIGNVGYKIRDITGVMKDIHDLLYMQSDRDVKEQDARIEKLRRESENETEAGSVTIEVKGWDEAWAK